MQQFVDGSTATPTHLYVHYIVAIDSMRTYRHAQYSKIEFGWITGSKYYPYNRLFLDAMAMYNSLWTYLQVLLRNCMHIILLI
jgi:hypothetical protein